MSAPSFGFACVSEFWREREEERECGSFEEVDMDEEAS